MHYKSLHEIREELGKSPLDQLYWEEKISRKDYQSLKLYYNKAQDIMFKKGQLTTMKEMKEKLRKEIKGKVVSAVNMLFLEKE